MKRQLWPENFNTYFQERADFIITRHANYQQDILRIARLTQQAQTKDIEALLRYLRPWDIEAEGNWIGREWLRLVAMQALCYLGSQSAQVREMLDQVATSEAREWRYFDRTLQEKWQRLTDSSCLPDAYADFQRCVREVRQCIDESQKTGPG